MTYIPGPPSPRADAVWREFYRIAQNMGTGNISDRGFVYVGDYRGDPHYKLQKAIDDAPCLGLVVCEPGVMYDLDIGIDIYQKPLHVDLNGSWWGPSSSFDQDAYLLTVSGCRWGKPASYYHHPCLQDPWSFFVDGFPHLSGVRISNGYLHGHGRYRPCRGIAFRGGNSHVELRDLVIVDMVGNAIAACDPNSSIGLDAENQFIQESVFRDVFVRNCGRTGDPSVWIGRNANGDSNHNNLRWERSHVIYSRGDHAIHVLNNNESQTNGRIQELSFENLFVHGNNSIFEREGAPTYSEPYAEADLIRIGQDGLIGTENRIRNVFMSGCRVIEQEEGYAAINIRQDTDFIFDGYFVASGVDRPGFMLSDAGACVIQNDAGFDLEDHIVIDGEFRYSGHQLHIGNNAHISLASMDGPNFKLNASDLDRIIDITSRQIQYTHPADADPMDEVDYTMIADSSNLEFGLRAWIMPMESLTANDSNYAKITIRPYNEIGTARDTIAFTTRTTAVTGGTGDWTAKVKLPIPIPERTSIPAGVGITIDKVGTGVSLPSFVLIIQTSQQLYLAIP